MRVDLRRLSLERRHRPADVQRHFNLPMVVQMLADRLFVIRSDMHWFDAHDNQMLIHKRLGSCFLHEALS